MKIAIAVESDKGIEAEVSMHFGRCPYFTVIDLEEGC